MCESIPNETKLYCISKEAPSILRVFDNPQEAQKALDLIRDAFHELYYECEYDLFTVTLTKVDPD